jgi:hypothetical protein
MTGKNPGSGDSALRSIETLFFICQEQKLEQRDKPVSTFEY